MSVNLSNDILSIIGDLHDGVSNPESWTRAMSEIAERMGCFTIFMGSIDRVHHVQSIEALGLPDAAVQLMAGPLGNPVDNPYNRHFAHLPFRAPVDHGDIGGQAVMENSRLWTDVAVPFGIRWSVGAILERSLEFSGFAMMGRSDTKGQFTTSEKALFASIIPHMARAARVRRELAALKALAADCMAALDHVGRGIVLTAEDGTVTYANAKAEAVFRQSDGLSGSVNGLKSGRTSIDAQLHQLTHDAAKTGYGRANVAVGAIAVGRASGKAPYTVIAEPLAPAHRERLGAPTSAGAILFIGDSAADQAPSPARLAAIYNLSPMESQIASRAAQGMGATEIAKSTGHSVNTVKSHMKEVFQKVGVDRLPKLVARIAADAGGIA